jgi:putative sterol carrier protein
MRYAFLSPEWFTEVDNLTAKAGDLKIPAAMKAVEINITISTAAGDKPVYIKDGVLSQGHRPNAPTSLTLDESLARKLFVEADTAAGIQAFLAGELKAEGDLKSLVAMQMEEPSAEQKKLAKAIAEITA